MRAEPVVDVRAARTLGGVLRMLGYHQEAVVDLLGEDAYGGDGKDAEVAARRLPSTQLGLAVRTLFLQLPVSREDALRAFGRKGVDALVATGLAETNGDVVTGARILPVGELLVAADGDPPRDGNDPPDYVAPYTPTSRSCDVLTPRRRGDRALDVGTGSGVLALLAARHMREVVATDVNERALAFGRLNAALNDIDNVDFRHGSLFEPAEGERFDLITCNPPFVVSPENRLVYRDSGFEGDGVTELVVHRAAAHLANGGYATVLGSWLGRDEEHADERVLAWTAELDCDCWIITFRIDDALEHAATWNAPLAGDPPRFAAALDRWTAYFDELGAEVVSEGAVLLRRRDSRRHTVRVDEVDEDALEDAGEQVERAFAARERLAALRKPGDLLDAQLALAMPLAFEREVAPRRDGVAVVDATVALREGTHDVLEAPADALDVVAALDGDETLAQTVDRIAQRLRLDDTDAKKLRRATVRLAEELLELGALRFA